jgi:ATP-binding cassette subfamily B protein
MPGVPQSAPRPLPRSGWKVLWEALRPHWVLTLLGVLAGLVWTAAKVSVPTLTRLAIDRGIIGRHHGVLLHLAMIIMAVGVVQGLAAGSRRYFAFDVAYRTEAELRERLFVHLLRLPFAFHDRMQTGQLMSRAATDLQQVQQFIVMIPITIGNAVIAVAVAVLLLSINAGLAVLALGTLPLINLSAKRFSSRIHPVAMNLQQELAGVAIVVEETVTGIRAVKGFGAESIQAAELDRRTGRVYDRAMEAARIRARFMPVLDFFPAVGLVAVLWYGGHQVLAHHLTVGGLVEFTAYVVMLIIPLRMTGMLVAQAQRAVVSAQRVDEILATEPTILDPAHPRQLPPGGGGEVRFEQVTFSYVPGAPPVLDGLDLSIRPGEAIALVGATASGKTTVARLIPRFYDVDGGRILIDGVDVRDLALTDLRAAVGLVFEDTFLFSDTVGANIAFARPDAPSERIREAARLAGADEFIGALPEGYGTEIGERGFSLSGGQRQRLAIARAFLADPRVLILDDATSSVDPTKEHEIRDALADVMRGRSTIIIAHRPATIALADRVLLLDEGRIVAEGTHEELLAGSDRYREVLARAAEERRERRPEDHDEQDEEALRLARVAAGAPVDG